MDEGIEKLEGEGPHREGYMNFSLRKGFRKKKKDDANHSNAEREGTIRMQTGEAGRFGGSEEE